MANNTRDTKKTRSFMDTMAAVGWSFIGLRRKRDFDQDVGGLNPVYVILGGLIGTALFVSLLLTVANLAVS